MQILPKTLAVICATPKQTKDGLRGEKSSVYFQDFWRFWSVMVIKHGYQREFAKCKKSGHLIQGLILGCKHFGHGMCIVGEKYLIPFAIQNCTVLLFFTSAKTPSASFCTWKIICQTLRNNYQFLCNESL